MTEIAKAKKSVMESLGTTTLHLLTLPPCMILGGYVLKTLWGWFMVPLGVRPLGIAWAIGLILLSTKLHPGATKDHKETPLSETLGRVLFWNGFLLLAGWTAKHWM